MKWHHTSASQIKTFRSCHRKWYRESVLGEKRPAGPAALRGQAIHAELEEYLEKGTMPKDGTAQALTRMLPKGGTIPAERIEVGFLWIPPDWRAPAKGFVDLCLPPNEIIDHKSTASLSYALTEEQARRDPQALIYAGVAMSGGLGLDFEGEYVRFRLNYATTRGAVKTRSVYVDLTPEEIVEGLDEIGSNVVDPQLSLSKSGVQWSEVQPNYASCDAFGGCPFRHDCQRVVKPQVKEVLSLGDANNFKATLERRKARQEISIDSVVNQDRLQPTQDIFDLSGSQYERANPPDGLPDGAPLPEKVQTKKQTFRYEGKAVSSFKAAELREAIIKISSQLTEAQKQSVPNGATPNGTKSENQSRLIAMLKIKNNPQSEKNMTSQKTQEAQKTQESLFWSITEESETATTSPSFEPLDDAHRAPLAPLEPPPPTEKPPIYSSEDLQNEPPPPIKQEQSETTPTPAAKEEIETFPFPPAWQNIKTKMVLVDAHCSGAVELERCLSGLIQEIENNYDMPLSVIQYNDGWKELAGHISRRGWFESGLEEIVRISSSSPLWTHCSHVIIPLADRVIYGTR